MDMNMIAKVMALEGPIVQAVVMEASGALKEITIDMTPKKNKVAEVLGGPATFVGQYRKGGVVLMQLRDPTEKDAENKGEFLFPVKLGVAEEPVRGDVLMLRMNKDAEPEDFTLEDYELVKKQQKEAEEKGEEEENEEDDEIDFMDGEEMDDIEEEGEEECELESDDDEEEEEEGEKKKSENENEDGDKTNTGETEDGGEAPSEEKTETEKKGVKSTVKTSEDTENVCKQNVPANDNNGVKRKLETTKDDTEKKAKVN
mmetsp:Transcript_25516/g.41178  ORF Transcript_25516/g.41178 Transcript_25516/m.41178 type:complete len:258 (+) Transcript_25516:19-792(+)